LFRLERCGDDANVDPVGDRVEDRHDEEQSRAFKRPELAEPQHHDPLPLIGDLDRIGDDRGDEEARDRDRGASTGPFRTEDRIGEKEAGGENDDEDEPRKSISLWHARPPRINTPRNKSAPLGASLLSYM